MNTPVAEQITPHADVLFEVSWETCNKVGGIYTVLMSKAAQAVKHYKEYYCVGPYFHDAAIGEFEESTIPEDLRDICRTLEQRGIICHFGTWLVKGNPKVILLDFHTFLRETNDIKKIVWDEYKIDSLNAPYDYNEPVVWSYAAGILIEQIAHKYVEKKIVAQFHEWLAGVGLLYLKKQHARVGTVFTTHATILGRAVASTTDLYKVLTQIEPVKEAYAHGIPAKFLTERASALTADVFTTVSEITGLEAEHLLGRKPDVLLPNGLDIEAFPSFEDISVKHQDAKFRIKELLLYTFFPHYSFNLDETLIFFIFARYEFKNKGIDVFIKALSRLNEELIKKGTEKTIAAFFFIPAGVKGIRFDVIEKREAYGDVKQTIDQNARTIRNNLLVHALAAKKLSAEHIFSEEFIVEMRKKLLKFNKPGKPSLSTHALIAEDQDAIIQSFHQHNLTNDANDKVKVIFYPAYLTGADGLLNLGYYDAILGCHLGVFPSLYEPWGYTPLEAGALGVCSVTTDLAGFGRYIQQQHPEEVRCKDHCDPLQEEGIYIIRRHEKSEEEIVTDLFNVFAYYASLTKQERIENKIEARRLAALADWKHLFMHYITAHNLALDTHS